MRSCCVHWWLLIHESHGARNDLTLLLVCTVNSLMTGRYSPYNYVLKTRENFAPILGVKTGEIYERMIDS